MAARRSEEDYKSILPQPQVTSSDFSCPDDGVLTGHKVVLDCPLPLSGEATTEEEVHSLMDELSASSLLLDESLTDSRSQLSWLRTDPGEDDMMGDENSMLDEWSFLADNDNGSSEIDHHDNSWSSSLGPVPNTEKLTCHIPLDDDASFSILSASSVSIVGTNGAERLPDAQDGSTESVSSWEAIPTEENQTDLDLASTSSFPTLASSDGDKRDIVVVRKVPEVAPALDGCRVKKSYKDVFLSKTIQTAGKEAPSPLPPHASPKPATAPTKSKAPIGKDPKCVSRHEDDDMDELDDFFFQARDSLKQGRGGRRKLMFKRNQRSRR